MKINTMLTSLLFLFFLQLLSDFVAAIYAFGLLGTSIPPQIICIVFLFSPVLLLVRAKWFSSNKCIIALAMLLSIVLHQIELPANADLYPINEPIITAWHYLPVIVMTVCFSAVFAVSAKPVTPKTSNTIRVLSYNIQQGYSDSGQKNFDGQLALLRKLVPDIIGLETTGLFYRQF